jgi:hypothetical protein
MRIPYQPLEHRKAMFSIAKINQFFSFREIIVICSEKHTKHLDTICGQTEEIF